MWISLCVTTYKHGFCCGMQRTVFFYEISPCQPGRTAYNAQPLRRQSGNANDSAGREVIHPAREKY
ncbi:hypothetical protein F3J40_24380 [Pantoea sp. Acro-835]|uniref:Uncharacterized protein n=1 Tax=Candidatus Pantoea multigeneris TaxID=2608357 RepID=A0ABX0RMZ1_9GAMM|nr:hypothetical protein [Pantoea multigeneris]